MTTNQILINGKKNLEIIYNKTHKLTQKAGHNLKLYFDDEKNINHISLFLYDMMPIAFKLSVRHEKFDENFKVLVYRLKNKIFVSNQEIVKEMENTKNIAPKAKRATKTTTKKTVTKKATVKKPVAKKVVIKTVSK